MEGTGWSGTRIRARRRWASRLGWCAAVLGAALLASPAAADEFVDRANDIVSLVRGNEALEPALYPALAAMDDCPMPTRGDNFEGLDPIRLLDPESPEWERMAAWATGRPQREAIEALAEVADPEERYLFSQPYGREGVSEAFVEADLYCDLGPRGLLVEMNPIFRFKLYDLHALVTVEAVRRAADGDGAEALDVLIDLLHLYRKLRDRPHPDEALIAEVGMLKTLEQIRDVVYTYFQDGAFTWEDLQIAVLDLDERTFRIEQMLFPDLSLVAGLQLMDRTMDEGGSVRTDDFTRVMAQLSVDGEPMLLFNEFAKWREASSAHADWFDTLDKLEDIIGDYSTRWDYRLLDDDLLLRPTDYRQMNKRTFAVVDQATRKLAIFERVTRRLLLTEFGATRVGLATVAFKLDNRRLPPALPALTPKYLRELDSSPDYYAYRPREQRYDELRYWVPVRDQEFTRREEPRGHRIVIAGTSLQQQFKAISEAQVEIAAETMTMSSLIGQIDFGQVASYMSSVQLTESDTSRELFGEEVYEELQTLEEHFSSYLLGRRDEFDRERYLELLDQALARYTASQEELRELTSQLRPLAYDRNATADQVVADMREGIDTFVETMNAMLTGFTTDSELDLAAAIEEQTGVTLEGVKSTLEEVIRGFWASSDLRDLVDHVAQGRRLDPNQYRTYVKMTGEVLSSPEVADAIRGVMSDFMASPAGAEVEQFLGMGVTDRFSVVVGDPSLERQNDFLLYSVYLDQEADLARSVGAQGVDLLFWPPVLSLQRQHLRGL